jgi:hypothetical protein
MAPGYNYPNDSVIISNLLAPAYITGALGIDYKPDNYLSVFVAPVTARITIVNNQPLADAGNFGVDKATYDSTGVKLTNGKKSLKEYGGYIRIIYSKNDWKQEFMKNVSLTSKIDLFSNYTEEPQNIDVSWENQIALKVNKYITVNFNTHLLYDDNTKNFGIDTNNDGVFDKYVPKSQFKQIVGVGFAYKF